MSSGTIPYQDITVKDGDYLSVPMEITGADGLPLDLTEAIVHLRIWVEGEDVDAMAPVLLGVADPPTAGIVLINLSPTDYNALTPRGPRYWFDVRVTGGTTVVEGRFFLEPSRVR